MPKLVFTCQARSAGCGLLGRGPLDCSQDRPPLLRRDRDAKLLAFQFDAVEPALFAKNDPPFSLYNLRRVGLDCLLQVKLAGYRTAVPHEQALSDQRLPAIAS